MNRTSDLCFDRYSGSYYVSMDHGTDPAFETCRFYKTFTVNRAVDLIQASCKFLRSVWILYHV